MSKIRILFFGVLEEATGKAEEEIPTAENLKILIDSLKQKYPELSNHHFSVAVNQEICEEGKSLSDGDEVALLPPFTGG